MNYSIRTLERDEIRLSSAAPTMRYRVREPAHRDIPRWPTRKNAANRPLTNDRMLSTSRLVADEDNVELLLSDNLVIDAG